MHGHRLPQLAIVLAAIVVATAASARGDVTNWYSFSSCPATVAKRVDPVTAVFTTYATAANTLNHLRFHSGWANTGGSGQSFASHGTCWAMQWQRADASVLASRFHVRAHATTHVITLLATPHHEDLVLTCGHAVDSNGASGSGFDQGRQRFDLIFRGRAGHSLSYAYVGNTASFKQCDGDLASSNGNVLYITVPTAKHP